MLRHFRSTASFMAMLPLLGIGFTADNGGAGGGGGSTDTGSGDTGKAGDGKGDATKTGDTDPATGKTFTQEQVNAAAAEARRKAERERDEAMGDAEKWRKYQEEHASDVEKAEKKGREEAAKEITEKVNTKLINSEVRARAAGMKFRNPNAAAELLQARNALAGIKVDDDGNVDSKAVELALTALATTDPYLVGDGTTPTAPAADAGLGSGSTREHKTEATPGTGRMRDYYKANEGKISKK